MSEIRQPPTSQPAVIAAPSRRLVMFGAAALALGGCSGTFPSVEIRTAASGYIDPRFREIYGPITTEPFAIPAVDLRQVNPIFYRQEVDDPTGEAPGTIIVEPTQKFLYFTLPERRAIRYGVGLGREGFGWDGNATIPRKTAWPTWTPPSEMIDRQPELEQYRNGMPPGLGNPLGARAMYLYQGNVDTLYRLHGTAEAYSIGNNVSSGCVRLLNHDIIDLYARTPTGTPVIVRPAYAA